MQQRIDARRRDRVVVAAARAGLVGPEHPAAAFVDLDGLRATVADLHAAFAGPSPVLHTFAVKAAALVPVVRVLADAGMGCEVASAGELAIARAAGVPAARIVFDSPAKTARDLADALALGVAVNADNLRELERLGALLAAGPSRSTFGLRINPQLGSGAIAATSTVTEHAKFGVPTGDPGGRAAVVEAFVARPWLTRLHVHVGSQGCPIPLMVAGVREAWELAQEIDACAGRHQVTTVDIGGGLGVNFADDEVVPTFAEYAAALRSGVPGLLDGSRTVVTEFGRAVVAKNGFTVARVEYTKEVGGRRIAVTHAGAHLAVRTVFAPDAWPLRIGVHAPDGTPRDGRTQVQDVAGPCCFTGDVVAHGRRLPVIREGDLVVLHDTGGYYASAPWTYNSFARPAIHGFADAGDGGFRFTAIRREQSVAEIVAEAGGDLVT